MSEEEVPQTFRFDEIVRYTDEEIQMILREVDITDLAVALHDFIQWGDTEASMEMQLRIFSNVSEQVEKLIREEMVSKESIAARSVEEARSRIEQQVQKLIQAGQVRHPRETVTEEQQSESQMLDETPDTTQEEENRLTSEEIDYILGGGHPESLSDTLERLNREGSGRRGIDLPTVAGLVLGIFVVVVGIYQSSSLFRHGPAAGFVILGALAVVLVIHGVRGMLGLMKGIGKAMVSHSVPPSVWIEYMVTCGKIAAEQGILALDVGENMDRIPDPFLKKGLRLVLDGVESETIQRILETALSSMEERHREGRAICETAGLGGVLFGILGMLLGLILWPWHVAGVPELGIGGVFVPLFWGVIVGGFCYALRGKLHRITAGEVLQRRIMMEGITSIQTGDHPGMIEEKLKAFVAPHT